jgi:hypothetical protein
MRVRVPRDLPTLAAALESGADRIVLQGEVELPEGGAGAILSRPVHISGGTLRASGGWALIIGEGVRLQGVKIQNPTGHGVRIVAGSPVLEDVELSVKGVAGVCEGQSRPILRRVIVDHAENGWLLREDTAPDGDELAVQASGSALVTSDRAAGHLARLALVSGDRFACVEAHGQSRTTLSGLTILSAGCGAVHVYGESQLRIAGGHIRKSGTADVRFPAIEVRETSAPTFSDLRIEHSGGRALFAHDSARIELQAVQIDHTGSHAVEAQDSVELGVQHLNVSHSTGGGVVLRGSVTGRFSHVLVDGTQNVGVGLGGEVRVELDQVTVRAAEGAGVRVAGTARAVLRQLRAELLGCPGVLVHEQGTITLDNPSLSQNRSDGFRAEGSARAIVRGGTIAANEGRGLVVSEQAKVRLESVQLTDNLGWSVEVLGDGSVRWKGGPPPARIRVQPGATWEDDSPGQTASV